MVFLFDYAEISKKFFKSTSDKCSCAACSLHHEGQMKGTHQSVINPDTRLNVFGQPELTIRSHHRNLHFLLQSSDGRRGFLHRPLKRQGIAPKTGTRINGRLMPQPFAIRGREGNTIKPSRAFLDKREFSFHIRAFVCNWSDNRSSYESRTFSPSRTPAAWSDYP